MLLRLSSRYLSFLQTRGVSYSSLFIILGSIVAGMLSSFIVLFLIVSSLPFFKSSHFNSSFTQVTWLASDNLYSVWPLLFGSLSVAIISSFISLFVGVAAALYMIKTENGTAQNLFRNLLVVFSSVPSVIYGLWCLDNITPMIAARFNVAGSSILAGSIALALMIAPHFILYIFDHLKEEYDKNRLSAKALGCSSEALTLQIVLPKQIKAILSGFFLQLARALGETMVVVMVCGNIPVISNSLLAPVRTFTANLALEMGYAEGTHLDALFFSSIVLSFLVIFILLGSRGLLVEDQ